MTALVVLALCPTHAHAYLDPGTGSFILQATIAVLLAGLVTIKHQWHRFRGFFRRSSKQESDLDLDE
jgi:hypothetical protein